MPGRKHSRRRRNKRRARRNNIQDTSGGSTIDNTNEAGHSCLSYAELMSSDNIMNGEAVAKLRAEIINLKDHLVSAHVELAELTFQNFEFRKSVDKYQEKMKVLNLIAFGPDSKSSESDQKKGIPDEKKTPPTSTCQCGKQNNDDDQTDYDDDSDTT